MDFQKRVSYRLQFLHRKLPIFSEITDFQGNQRNIKFWAIFKRQPSTVQFEIYQNEQNEQFSVKSADSRNN